MSFPAHQPTNHAAGIDSHASLDDLFDYDPNLGNTFEDENNANSADPNSNGRKRTRAASEGLGIDEEIKITKKRKPIAKLDDERSGTRSVTASFREAPR